MLFSCLSILICNVTRWRCLFRVLYDMCSVCVLRVLTGSPVELVRHYYHKFGDKPCCFTDLQPYITILLDEDQQREVAAPRLLTMYCVVICSRTHHSMFPSQRSV